jgi:hypothetical protein
MSIAPQNLMSTLRGMPDAQLQKYAALHKNDPFVFPLAFQESQDRQRARAAQQAQGQQPMKVVDQDLQQMMPQPAPQPMMPPQQMAQAPQGGQAPQQLPENSGIGQLPAPNMQNMADGGIVAFADGGEVQGYAEKGLVELPGGLGIYNQGAFATQAGGDEIAKYKAYLENLRTSPATKQQLLEKFIAERGGKMPQAPAPAAAPVAPPAMPAPAAPPTTPTPAAAATTPTPAAPSVPIAPPTAPTAKPMPAPGLPSAEAYIKQFEAALPEKEKVDDAEAETAFANKRNAPFEEYSTKAKSMVDKEKNRLSEGKEQDFYMSLIEGGLAAAGATGPNGIQNIAQGFSKGAASYKDALKDFRKASQENAKMELDIDKATAAQKIGNIDQWEKRTEAAKERNSKRDQYAASGLSQLLSHDISGKYAYAGQSLAANTQLQAYGMPGAQERMVQRFSDDPKFAAAYEKFATMSPEAKAGVVTRDNALKNWSSSIMLQQKYPKFDDYYKMAATTSAGATPELKYNPQTGRIE